MMRLEDNVALTESLTKWLRRVGLEDKAVAEAAVDTADIIAAADQVKALVERMTECDPATALGADQALTAASEIEVQLFTELKSHLETLEDVWTLLLERLDALSEGR
jgi:hypothetical protein